VIFFLCVCAFTIYLQFVIPIAHCIAFLYVIALHLSTRLYVWLSVLAVFCVCVCHQFLTKLWEILKRRVIIQSKPIWVIPLENRNPSYPSYRNAFVIVFYWPRAARILFLFCFYYAVLLFDDPPRPRHLRICSSEAIFGNVPVFNFTDVVSLSIGSDFKPVLHFVYRFVITLN